MKSKIHLIYVVMIGLYAYLVLSFLNTFLHIPTYKPFDELSFLAYALVLALVSWLLLVALLPGVSRFLHVMKPLAVVLLLNGVILHIVRQIELFE